MLEKIKVFARETLLILSESDKQLVLLAIAVYFLSVLVYAYRWHIILKHVGVKLGVSKASLAYLMGVFVNNITPSMKAGGEIIRIAYAYVETRAPLPNIVNSVVFERITEAIPVAILALLGVAGEVLIGGSSPIHHLLGVALLVVAAYLGFRYWDRILAYAIERFKLHDRVPLDDVQGVRELFSRRRLVLLAIALGSMVWVMDVLRLYIIALAVGWRTSITRIVMASVMYLAIGFLALTPGGVGIVEGGLTAVFTALGAPPSKALAIVFIERLISYVLATAIGGLALSLGGGKQAWTLLRSRWLRTGSTRK